MKRILFVDDEVQVLQGLRRLFVSMRGQWEMTFVDSAEQALAVCERAPVDVVVTDMRMPVMNGAELLEEVRQRHPETVRIILSGYSNHELSVRTASSAHQFLTKPCNSDLLKSTIMRACALRDTFSSPEVALITSRVKSLPTLPSLYQEIVREASKPEGSMLSIGRIVERDLAISAKVLQLVNSAFFGLPVHVSSAAQAASTLGLETLKSIVLSVGLFREFDGVSASELRAIWEHSVVVGSFARAIARAERADARSVDHAFLAGLLHELGRLILLSDMRGECEEAKRLTKETGIHAWDAEREVLGTSHAEVGAYLLGLWGLADPIVEAVAYHHHPERCGAHGFSTVCAVYAAQQIELECRRPPNAVDAAPSDPYLAQLGLLERWPAWRTACDGALEEGSLR